MLDLFAGSGALGFEALSRGAALCLFVETDDAARGAIRSNIDTFGLFGRTRVHRRSATDLGPRPGGSQEAFDLVFLDAPYGKGLSDLSLACALAGGWIAPDATVIVETAADEALWARGFDRVDHRIHGAAALHILKPLPAKSTIGSAGSEPESC